MSQILGLRVFCLTSQIESWLSSFGEKGTENTNYMSKIRGEGSGSAVMKKITLVGRGSEISNYEQKYFLSSP